MAAMHALAKRVTSFSARFRMSQARSPKGAAQALPRVVFIEEVAQLIGKAETTIRTCATNVKYHHLIPRPWKMPGSRRLCWYEHEVLAWIESARPAAVPMQKRGPGRPTKVEQLRMDRESWRALLKSAQNTPLDDLGKQ
jgi:predicted DNA-binding transcriptional regulator AlpA